MLYHFETNALFQIIYNSFRYNPWLEKQTLTKLRFKIEKLIDFNICIFIEGNVIAISWHCTTQHNIIIITLTTLYCVMKSHTTQKDQ